eukprot:gnl/MRDRNA2_/MRDRNA2_80235_c0_seq1.p2 gnl/MRDRNA2_/MRDRNA2_80235_c0~~gnl/MRDRNA2_/MRDRNA2_80235_c0_seq1.p2  ORF type:complete len:106 (+),score=25.39 gnl/MRDRNA2_/MRDRNA2_80235_c0_seq1:408-725(+)
MEAAATGGVLTAAAAKAISLAALATAGGATASESEAVAEVWTAAAVAWEAAEENLIEMTAWVQATQNQSDPGKSALIGALTCQISSRLDEAVKCHPWSLDGSCLL